MAICHTPPLIYRKEKIDVNGKERRACTGRQAIYNRIDNGVYSALSDQWWQPDSAFYQMKVSLNPARVGYAKRKLIEELKIDPKATAALDVGSGGIPDRDQANPEDVSGAHRAAMDAGGLIKEYSAKLGTVRWIRHVVNQGFSPMENLLYTGGPPPNEPTGTGQKAGDI